MKMNLHCFANLIPIMILALFSNSGLINATEVGKRTDALEASSLERLPIDFRSRRPCS